MTAPALPLLILTPHSSGALPPGVLLDMLGEAAFDTAQRGAFLRQIFLDGDPYTDLIYHVPGARQLCAPWSRFAADTNRDRDDTGDNGVIKLLSFGRQPLYPPGFTLTPQAREARLSAVWDPYEASIVSVLSGQRLMIVGHSMAPLGPALGPDTGSPRPGITLMLGLPEAPSLPTPHWEAVEAAANEAFGPLLAGEPSHRVAVGEPWADDGLSVRHSRRSGVPAFGIEVNAGLYLRGGQVRPGQLARLNAAFGRFARAALEIMS
ncbi:N-formylglutamate amidohydrolase [Deinococcus sp.]|uniref:N-formylglutamate amidohydrolase n=1 Tax=Deinococcus sp. TaxID=47478 RepID=UPI0025D641ED|nr:N-formylglutamate amidohydrolase [Deinococcus sp.]